MVVLKDWISPEYLSAKKITSLQKQFQKNQPFPHLQLPNFFLPEKTAKLLTALSKEKFFPKESDLFQLKQTSDFQQTKNKMIKEFRSFLCDKPFLNYMQVLTKQNLKANYIDLSASLYEDTDYLLPHDDRVEGRKIAFFLYLSTLTKNSGGRLILYNKNHISKTITPHLNTFAFFLVSQKSVHAVEEVNNAQRITLSGWFHGY